MSQLSNKFLRKIVLDGSKDTTRIKSKWNEFSEPRSEFPRVVAVNLFEQFHRISNIWFLIVSIFELLPYNLSPSSNWSTIVPLSALLSISLVRDIYNSFIFRSKLKKINDESFPVWTGLNFVNLESKYLSEGMIVMISAGQRVPADMLIIARSNLAEPVFQDLSTLVGSYIITEKFPIETIEREIRANDSDTDAKVLEVQIRNLEGEIKVTEPSPDYLTFSGTLKLHHHPKAFKLSSKNLLVAGAPIKNSDKLLLCIVETMPNLS